MPCEHDFQKTIDKAALNHMERALYNAHHLLSQVICEIDGLCEPWDGPVQPSSDSAARMLLDVLHGQHLTVRISEVDAYNEAIRKILRNFGQSDD